MPTYNIAVLKHAFADSTVEMFGGYVTWRVGWNESKMCSGILDYVAFCANLLTNKSNI